MTDLFTHYEIHPSVIEHISMHPAQYLFSPISAVADDWIVPGQPLPWSYSWRRSPTHRNVTSLQVGLSFAGDEIYRESVRLRASENYVERHPPRLIPGARVASSFWRIGTKTLELVVSGLDEARTELDQWRTDLSVVVEPESVGQSWFEWIFPRRDVVQDWNREYTPRARLYNRSQYAHISAEGLLRERNTTDGTAAESGGTASAMGTVPGSSSVLSFPPRRQTWQWLLPLVYVVRGPSQKAFVTHVELTVRDEYGNPYNFSTGEQPFLVRVSNEKFLFGSAAMGFAATAAALTITAAALAISVVGAPAAPGVWTAATVAYGAAREAGLRANDPPEIDSKFEERVSLDTRIVAPEEFKEYGGLRSFLEQAIGACRLLDQLGVVIGKVAGAQAAGDQLSAEIQKADLAGGQAALSKMRRSMDVSSVQAVKEIQALLERDEVLDAVDRWETAGLPPEVIGIIRENSIEEVVNWIEKVGFSRELFSAVSTGVAFDAMAEAINYAAMALPEEVTRLQDKIGPQN